MNVLIIYCHPSVRSYTFELLQYSKAVLAAHGHTVDVSDLYAQDFKSDMTEQEYEREGRSNLTLPIPEDVEREHKKLASAEAVIFLYPVWWSDCPAKLKGWFDRVYTAGYVYKQKNDQPKLKTIPHGIVICTAGYTPDELSAMGIAQSMKAVMLTDRLGSRFQNKEMIMLGGTLDKEKVRAQHQEQLTEAIRRISGHI